MRILDVFMIVKGMLQVLFIAIFITWVTLTTYNAITVRIEIYRVRLERLVDTPTFTREVTYKQQFVLGRVFIIPTTLYKLHVVGAYIRNDQVIEVNQFFWITKNSLIAFSLYDYVYGNAATHIEPD